jgi:hypothetical protein
MHDKTYADREKELIFARLYHSTGCCVANSLSNQNKNKKKMDMGA